MKYKVDEVENGKTINSRSYTMMVKNGSSATVRIGSRVPYNTGGSQFQYQNVGMNINCKISREEGGLIVHTKVDMLSVQGKGAEAASESHPVIGQFQVENSTVVDLGKPEFVGSADDVPFCFLHESLQSVRLHISNCGLLKFLVCCSQ